MKATRFVSVLGTFVILCGVSAASAEANMVPGWTIEKTTARDQTGESCLATWDGGGPNALTIESLGGLLTLAVSSPSFDEAKHEETVTLSKSGAGKLQRPARVADRTYGITIDDQVGSLLEKEGPFVLTAKGTNYSFSVTNIRLAIQAVRRCTEEHSKSETAGGNKRSFPVPAGWESLDVAGGCAARLGGDEVDTYLTINNKDQVLLIAGRKDWNFWGQDIELTLQIDSQSPLSLKGTQWSNLILVLLLDDKDVAALRSASSLKWQFPFGGYSTKVRDVGSALDATAACTREKRISTPN